MQSATGNPAPVISSIFPASVVSQTVNADVRVVATGSGFRKEAVLKFGGIIMPTDAVFPPTNHVSATVAQGYFTFPTLVNVWVENAPPDGGPSNVLTIRIDELPITLTKIFPTSIPASSALFSMQITGRSEERRVGKECRL